MTSSVATRSRTLDPMICTFFLSSYLSVRLQPRAAPGGPTGPKGAVLRRRTGRNDAVAALDPAAVRVAATFFNLGQNATYRPADVRSEATIGAQLANHTWDHPQLTPLSATAQGDQMDAASAEQHT